MSSKLSAAQQRNQQFEFHSREKLESQQNFLDFRKKLQISDIKNPTGKLFFQSSKSVLESPWRRGPKGMSE
jgi:hypothetical protein